MFIVWRRKLHTDGAVILSATLAECRRIEGKNRQAHIKGLGSINEGHINVRCKQAQFHELAETRLNSLDISKKEKAKVVKALRARVPCPTQRQLEAEARAIQVYLGSVSKINKIC